MSASGSIGRVGGRAVGGLAVGGRAVGGLAVALGIGAAAATGSLGVAAAAPAEDASSPSADSASSAQSGPRKPRPAARTRAPRGAAETPRRAGEDNNPAPAAATRPAKPAPAVGEPTPAAPVQEVGKVEPVAGFQARAVAPVVSPAAPVAIPVTEAPPPLRAVPRAAVAAAVGTVRPAPVPFSSSGPGSPAESAMSWTVLAAVRRLGRPDAPPAPAATVSIGQIFAPRAAARLSFFARFRNKTPTASPTQNTQNPTGAITGNLNAADADGDSLTYKVATAPARGTVQIGPDGVFTYTPDKTAAHNGLTDQFAITVSDEAAGNHRHGFFNRGGHTATSTITVTVTPVNSAPDGTATAGSPDADGIVTGQVNAADDDGDPISYTGPDATAKGAVVVGSGGAFTYTPTAAARHAAAKLTATAADKADAFTITISDDRGASTVVPVTVQISGANAEPSGTVGVGDPDAHNGAVSGLVAGADTDGDPLSYTGSTTTAKGAVTIGADGSFSYTPTVAARHGAAALTATAADRTDQFTVTIEDGYGGSATVPVTVTISPVNTAPTATAGVGAPDPGTGVVAGAVTAADLDGDTVTYAGATTAKGTAVVSADGKITYTPTAAARHAAAAPTATSTEKSDSFTITLGDGHGGSATVPVTVAIAPANTAPTAALRIAGLDAATGVVTGAVLGADADGDPLTYTGSTTTAKGSVSVDADGAFIYTPTADARHRAAALNATPADRTDTVTVTVSDAYGGTANIDVAVAISPLNTAPVASVSTPGAPNADTGVVAGTVRATDADRDTLSYSGSTTTDKGAAAVSADGTFTYTPTAAARHAAANLTATPADKTDVFTVVVTDGHGGSAAVPVTVTVSGTNAAPTGTADTGEPDAATGLVAGAVLGVDGDGDALSYSGSGVTAKGTVVVSADGAYTYTPTALARHIAGLAGATGADTTDTFIVTVADGYGGTVTVPVTVAVSPAGITFDFVYGTGSQHWTPEARAALNTAATRLASSIVVDKPVTVTYDVVGENSTGSGWLGTSYAKFASGSPGFYGTVVQTAIITGVDANGAATDARIGMNFAYPWALGSSVPNNKYDFQSVVAHELVHSLGIMTGLGDPASMDRNWTIYDRYLVTANGADPIGADYVWNAAYTPNLTGANGGVFFGGPNAVAVYGGPVPLYTSGTWVSGTSLVHLDAADAPPGTTYLMDPSDGYGPGVRTPSAVELGILQDLGYTVYQPAYAVFLLGFGFRRRRRSALSGQAPPISERHCSRSDTR